MSNGAHRYLRTEGLASKCLAVFAACATVLSLGLTAASVEPHSAEAANGDDSTTATPAAETTTTKPGLAHDAAPNTTDSDGTLIWTPVTEFIAEWKNGGITSKTMYWQVDDQANQVGGAKTTGFRQTMMMRNVYKDDNNADTGAPTKMDNEPILDFVATQNITAIQNPFSRNTSLSATNLFSTQAIGVFGGEDDFPNRQRSLYFWDWGANTNPRSGTIDCSTVNSNSDSYVAYTPIIRVDGYDAENDDIDPGHHTNIFWTCMPTPFSPTSRNRQAAGGESNDSTGYIYMTGAYGVTTIGLAATATTPNTGGSQFAIWDPYTGRFSRSGSIQAGDYSPGMTHPPTDQLKALIWNKEYQPARCQSDAVYTKAQEEHNSACTYVTDSSVGLDTSADMGLDAEGNIYTYGSSAASNTGTTVLLKIRPALDDATGTILDLPEVSVNPWRYTVVTHTHEGSTFDAGGSASAAASLYGLGIHNGNFLMAGNLVLTNPVTPLRWETGTILPTRCRTAVAETDCNSGTAVQVRIDPLTGQMEAIAAENNANTPLMATNPNTAYYAANDDRGSKDAASTESLKLIQGNVYNDATASADPSQFTGLSGQVVDLYDSEGILIGTTVTASDGSYNFIVPMSGTYYVRLVQPKVDGVNAYQTWASAVDGTGADGLVNTAAVTCVNVEDNTVTSTEAQGSPCQGAQRFPYVDPNPQLDGDSQVTQVVDPGWHDGSPTWAHFATVTVNSFKQIPKANFAVSTARGSSGDASGSTQRTAATQDRPEFSANIGPFRTTEAQHGAFFKNPLTIEDPSSETNPKAKIFTQADGLQLGESLGDYTDGVPDPEADNPTADSTTNLKHTDTDDGVQVIIPVNASEPLANFCSASPTYSDTVTLPLQGAALTSGQTYCIKTSVQGSLAGKEIEADKPSVVLGWQSNKAPATQGGWTTFDSTIAYAQWVGSGLASSQSEVAADESYDTYATLKTPLHSSPALPVQTRFTVMSHDFFVNNGGDADFTNTAADADLTGITTSQDDCVTKQAGVAGCTDDGNIGIYSGAARFSDKADSQYWVQPGEVEDSQYQDVNSSLRIIAKVKGDGELNDADKPLKFEYTLDGASTDLPSTKNDEVSVSALNQNATSTAIHTPENPTSTTSAVTVSTTLPDVAGEANLTIDGFSCSGAYLGKDGQVKDYPITEDNSKITPIGDDKKSWNVNTYFSEESQSDSGLTVTCTFNYAYTTQVTPTQGTVDVDKSAATVTNNDDGKTATVEWDVTVTNNGTGWLTEGKFTDRLSSMATDVKVQTKMGDLFAPNIVGPQFTGTDAVVVLTDSKGKPWRVSGTTAVEVTGADDAKFAPNLISPGFLNNAVFVLADTEGTLWQITNKDNASVASKVTSVTEDEENWNSTSFAPNVVGPELSASGYTTFMLTDKSGKLWKITNNGSAQTEASHIADNLSLAADLVSPRINSDSSFVLTDKHTTPWQITGGGTVRMVQSTENAWSWTTFAPDVVSERIDNNNSSSSLVLTDPAGVPWRFTGDGKASLLTGLDSGVKFTANLSGQGLNNTNSSFVMMDTGKKLWRVTGAGRASRVTGADSAAFDLNEPGPALSDPASSFVLTDKTGVLWRVTGAGVASKVTSDDGDWSRTLFAPNLVGPGVSYSFVLTDNAGVVWRVTSGGVASKVTSAPGDVGDWNSTSFAPNLISPGLSSTAAFVLTDSAAIPWLVTCDGVASKVGGGPGEMGEETMRVLEEIPPSPDLTNDNGDTFTQRVYSIPNISPNAGKNSRVLHVTATVPRPAPSEGPLVIANQALYSSKTTPLDVGTIDLPTVPVMDTALEQLDWLKGNDSCRAAIDAVMPCDQVPAVIEVQYIYLPAAGAFPWLTVTGVALLAVGTLTGAGYVILWARKRNDTVVDRVTNRSGQ